MQLQLAMLSTMDSSIIEWPSTRVSDLDHVGHLQLRDTASDRPIQMSRDHNYFRTRNAVNKVHPSSYLCHSYVNPKKWAREGDCNLVKAHSRGRLGPGPGENNCTNAPTASVVTRQTEGEPTPWPSQPWRAREKHRKVSDCHLHVMFCCSAGCTLDFKPPRSYDIS